MMEAESLEVPFSEHEIHRELMGMDRNKVPEPDGLISSLPNIFCQISRVR